MGAGTGEGDVTVINFKKDQEVWISSKEDHMWETAYVHSQEGPLVLVYQGQRKKNLNLLQDAVFPTNPRPQPDMTSLYYINEPGILMNLEERSLNDEPYTFMGNVLVAVNPLKNIKAPGLVQVKANIPHPFSVAENSFKQLGFAYDHRKYHSGENSHEHVNQSIVTSGESGAGKTEQCKMVLKHLVDRCSNEDSAEIDKQLLESNYITESFGNAQTLRNHNSSRFGKFLKLFFQQQPVVKGHVPDWKITGATVQTYLLERSRVVFHGEKERNYHIFYHILAGLDGSKKKELGLDDAASSCGFRYLSALKSNLDLTTDNHVGKDAYKKEILKTDKEEYAQTLKAMLALGFDDQSAFETFKIAAGILHLGNIGFQNEFKDNNDIAVPVSYGSYNPAEWAAKLLGLDSADTLLGLLVEERRKIRGEVIITELDKVGACDNRDNVSKSLYNLLFNHVIGVIDATLNGSSSNDEDTPYIGVLDIFGFETFERNGFEQLLINFANEALQATFNRSVFENEAALYKKERLVLDGEQMQEPPSNTECMELLVGTPNKDGKMLAGEVSGGLLLAIDDACQSIEPSDLKMLNRLHQNFRKHPNFKRPHPKMMQKRFIIKHFAGTVPYTIGFFVEKNKDRLPPSIQEVFKGSSNAIISELSTGGGKQTKRNATVVRKFRQDISSLVETLESTNTSFIRCVKPNFHLIRPDNNKGWFERKYISKQLRNLSIPQTAEVLQNGFPTRLTYKSLLDQYRSLLPDSAMSRWSKSGGQEEVFVKALFYSFEVETHIFKLGLTMVFFRSGELAKLDEILRKASNWKEMSKKDKERIIERFIFYYTRMQWRRVFARMVAAKKFLELLEFVRERERKRKEEEERLRKLKEEEERKKKEAAAELEAQKKAEEEGERRAAEELANEQVKMEEEYVELLEKDSGEHDEETKVKVEEIKRVEEEIQQIARVEVEIEIQKEQRDSVTSEIIRAEIEDRVKNLRKQYAMEKAMENVRKVVDDTTKVTVNTFNFIVRVVKDLVENTVATYQTIAEQTRPIREDIERKNQALVKLFIKEARKQPWFAKAHDELLRLDNEFKTLLKDIEDKDDRVKKRSNYNTANLKKTNSVLIISREEARNPLLSGHRQISSLDNQLNEGTIQPTDYAKAAQKLKETIGMSDEGKEVRYQFSPKNSETEESLSDSESVVAPSMDPKGWCRMPLLYNGGLVYFKVKVEKDPRPRNRNFKLSLGWEKTIKGEPEVVSFEVQGTAGEFALLYDSLRKRASTFKGIAFEEFPFWDESIYKKQKKGFKLFAGRVDRDKRAEFLTTCVNEKELRKQPEAIGNWLEETFQRLYGCDFKPKELNKTNRFFEDPVVEGFLSLKMLDDDYYS